MDKKGISRAGLMGIVVVIVIAAVGAGYFLMSGPGEEEDTIKIGVIGPMKQMTGRQMEYGAELAVEQINEQGGVLGKDLEIVTGDTETDPTIAVQELERLVKQQNVDVFVGGQRTEAVMQMQEELADYDTILMGAGAATDILCDRVGEDYEKYKYFFMQSPYPSSKMGEALSYCAIQVISKQIAPKLGEPPKITILTEANDYGRSMQGAYKAFLSAYGIEPVMTIEISEDARSVSSELSTIEGTETNIILMAISGEAGATFAKDWGEMKIEAFPIGINVEAQEYAFWDRTGGQGEYLVGSHNAGLENATPISSNVFDYFVEELSEYPSYNGYGAYDGVFNWAAAVERAGTLETDNVIEELEYDPDPDKYSKFERFGKELPQGTGSFSYNPNGFNENHYATNYPYQPNKTWDTIEGPMKGLGGWVWGQWLDGEKLVVWPEPYDQAELQIPPWMLEE